MQIMLKISKKKNVTFIVMVNKRTWTKSKAGNNSEG